LGVVSAFGIKILGPSQRAAGVTRMKQIENKIFLTLSRTMAGRSLLGAVGLWRLAVDSFFDFLITRRPANIIGRFPLYAPGSRGPYPILAAMTMATIERIPSLLAELAEFSSRPIVIGTLSEQEQDARSLDSSERLGRLLKQYGSDKTRHGYHTFYGKILQDSQSVKRVLEIGLGTNNEDVISHMTSDGKPGASLRAFRDFCPNAQIYGADLDRRILFKDDRIQTYFVDQLDQESIESLRGEIPTDFDLVIDDGLHSPDANMGILLLGLQIIKVGGWVVIEDIKPAALPLWKVAATLLPAEYEAIILQTNYELIFAVRRLR